MKKTARLGQALGAAFLAFVVAGCTAQPLYAPDVANRGGISGSPFAGQVSFASPDSRLEQVVRSAMLFRINGSGDSSASNAIYDADLNINAVRSGRFRTADTSAGQTSAAIMTVNGTMKLSDPTTGQVVREFKRSTIAAFDRNRQDFANERAQLDAENRAAEELAEIFSALLAAELRKRQ